MSKLRLVPPDGVLPDDGDDRWSEDDHWADKIATQPAAVQHFMIRTFVEGAEELERIDSALREAWNAAAHNLCRQGIDPTPEEIIRFLTGRASLLFVGGRGVDMRSPVGHVAYALDSLRAHGVPRAAVLAATGWTRGAYKERLRRGKQRRPPEDS
jgi:hypothetical protein